MRWGWPRSGCSSGSTLRRGFWSRCRAGPLAARFGEKRVVGLAMGLMLLGAILFATVPTYEVMVVARVLSGIGGVVLNIVMTKMLIDWFVGRELSTAMAIFVNSWPVGIALALLTLPAAGVAGGLPLVWIVTCGVIALGLVLFVVFYAPPPGQAAPPPGLGLARLPLYPLGLAGLVWAFYNAALAMVFSFGPALLSDTGWSVAAAGSATGAFMVVLAIFLPLGGILADRTGRRDAIILLSLGSFAVLMPILPHAGPVAVAVIFAVTGVLYALAAGPIMTLPSEVLPPEVRAFGIGVFWTIYYVAMMLAPRIAGGLADQTGDIGIAFRLGAGMAGIALVALWLFRRAGRAPARAT
jgi:MFS family permease